MTHIVRLGRFRDFAHRMVDCAPDGSVMEIKPPKRSLDQNAIMHAMITRVAAAKPQGRNYPVDIWKPLFMAMCGHKVRFEPALDDSGVVPLGFKTSRLSKAECSELIDCIAAYAAEHGIDLGDQSPPHAAPVVNLDHGKR